jgi:1-pyrroline-5-carboxylate dehydrogenase
MDEVECEAYSKQHHYAKGSAQREQLTAALESFQKKTPLQVPIVVGGKEVSLTSTTNFSFY